MKDRIKVRASKAPQDIKDEITEQFDRIVRYRKAMEAGRDLTRIQKILGGNIVSPLVCVSGPYKINTLTLS
jgi:hypothetical protein